jgi:alpha-L-rhamnosidase
MYGKVESNWQLDDRGFHLRVTIPANTTATVRIPGAASSQVTENERRLENAPGIVSVSQARPDLVITIGSGTYRFESIP